METLLVIGLVCWLYTKYVVAKKKAAPGFQQKHYANISVEEFLKLTTAVDRELSWRAVFGYYPENNLYADAFVSEGRLAYQYNTCEAVLVHYSLLYALRRQHVDT